MPTIAVLFGPESSASLLDIVKAARKRYDLILVLESEAFAASIGMDNPSFGDVVIADRDRWPSRIAATGADGVTTFNDAYVEDLDNIARSCSLRGAAAPGAWDKLEQRRRLNAVGASAAAVERVDSYADFCAARLRVGSSGFLKPRRSSTSRGIVVTSALDSDTSAWARTTEHANLLYEAYMDARPVAAGLAPFVSVETVSVGGVRSHIAITDKLALVRGHLETGDVTPSGLDAEYRRDVLRVVDLALDALEIDDRVTHTEIRLTSTGPQVIEVNGRLGGFVQGLVTRVAAINPCRLALDVAVGAVAGHEPAPPAAPSGAGLLLVPLDSGDDDVARAVADELDRSPHVDGVELPAPVSPVFRSVAAWFGAPTGAQVLDNVKEVVRALSCRRDLDGAIDRQWIADLLDAHA